MIENKRGQLIITNLLWLFIVVAVMIALIPQFNTLLNMSQQSDYLNCRGYYYNGDPNSTYSYNASLPSNTLACLSINFYLPYIVLGVLIAGVSKLMLGRLSPDQVQ